MMRSDWMFWLVSFIPASVNMERAGVRTAVNQTYQTEEENSCVHAVQSLSLVWLFATPWTAVHQGFFAFTVTQSLLKPMSFESVMPSNNLILCCLLFLLPSIFPNIRVFSKESSLQIRWPSIKSFSFNEYSMNIQGWFPLGLTGLISLLSKALSRGSPVP